MPFLDTNEIAVPEAPCSPMAEGVEDLDKVLDTLRLLQQFQTSLNPDNGICREDVKALIENCQVSLDERYPLQSFTVTKSTQNYDVAMEGILKRSGELILDFLKKVIELIRKGATWLINAIRSLFTRTQKVKDEVEKVKVVAEANDAAEEILKNVSEGAVAAGAPEGPLADWKLVHEAKIKVDESVSIYHGLYNGLASALVNEREFVGQIRFLGIKIPDILKHLEQRLDGMIEAIRNVDHQGAFRTQLENLRALKIDPAWFHGRGGEIPELREIAKTASFGEYMAQLDALVHQLSATHLPEAANWHLVAKVMANPDSGYADPFVLMPDNIKNAASQLQDRLGRMSDLKIIANLIERYPAEGQEYKLIVDQLADDFYGLMRLLSVSILITDTQVRLATAVYNIEVLTYHWHLLKAQASKDRDIIDKMNTIQSGLREKISKWNKMVPHPNNHE